MKLVGVRCALLATGDDSRFVTGGRPEFCGAARGGAIPVPFIRCVGEEMWVVREWSRGHQGLSQSDSEASNRAVDGGADRFVLHGCACRDESGMARCISRGNLRGRATGDGKRIRCTGK